MQSTIEQPYGVTDSGRNLTPLVLIGGLILGFFAAPWSLEHKAHAALHGICAQTPSHTFLIGGQSLPFDARMTGIYAGFAVAFACLAAMGRHRAARLPSFPLLGLLVLLVGAMAIDGFNSLLLDLGRPHPYQPDNWLRLVTGMGTGIALAVIYCYLFGITLWRRPQTSARVLNWRDLLVIIPAQAPFALLVLAGWKPTADILTVFLVLSAVFVIACLALIAIVLIRRLDFTFDRVADLQSNAVPAVFAAVVVLALLSSGRFLLEHLTGIQPLP